MQRALHWLAAVLGLCIGVPAAAQILIGQTSGFSGPVAAGVKEVSDGAKLYLDAVNAKGGVNGQKIELVAMDDKFDPKLAAQNAKVLITEKNVVALFLSRGTPHTQAILPLLEQYKVPLIAPSTGAMALHKPVNPWVFNVRATYQREAEKAVQHLATVGTTRPARCCAIATVHTRDDDIQQRQRQQRDQRQLDAQGQQQTGKKDDPQDISKHAHRTAVEQRCNARAVFLHVGKQVANTAIAQRAGRKHQQVVADGNASGLCQ